MRLSEDSFTCEAPKAGRQVDLLTEYRQGTVT